MHHDSEGKGKKESRVLPIKLKSTAMKRCIEGNTFDIVKKVEVDGKTREAKSTQVCKDKARITFKQSQESELQIKFKML